MNNNQKLQLNHLKQSRRYTLFLPKMVLKDKGCFGLSVFSVAPDFFDLCSKETRCDDVGYSLHN